MAPGKFGTIPASQGLTYWYNALTDGTATQLSGGRIPRMTPVQASAFLGSMTGEHGKLDWNKLDVVEMGSGKGRGAAQYTGVRRTPYDAAVNAARAAGKDPNSAQWQFEYFINEYKNKDLIGWTRVFEKMPQFKNVQEGVMYFTGSAQKGKGYFRPDERSAHYDKRTNYGQQIYNLLGKPQAAPTPNQPETPASPTKNQSVVDPNFVQKLLKQMGIGKQSFNMDKLQTNLGEIASAGKGDVGLAIFSATKYKNNWNKLTSDNKALWRSVGGQMLGNAASYAAPSPNRTYSLPQTTKVGASQYNPVTKVDLSIGGKQPGDIGYGSSSSSSGGSGFNQKSASQVYYEANKDYFDKTGKYDQYGGQYGADKTGRYSGTVNNLSGSGWTGGYSMNIGGGGYYTSGAPSYSSGSVATNTGMGSIGTPSASA